MGSTSAGLKTFMEATSGRWMERKWVDKLAAGFTNSGSQNGDKQNTLIDIASFAAQHGMVWINLNLMPNVDEGPDKVPSKADLDTAKKLGERVANCARRWAG